MKTKKLNGKPKPSNRVGSSDLLGQFFHSIGSDGKINWQGVVLSNPEPGWYYVQLFEWGMGEPNVRRLVRIEYMGTWLFYEDVEAMRMSYFDGVARAGGPYRDPDLPLLAEAIREAKA